MARADRYASEKERAAIKEQQEKVLGIILDAMQEKGLAWCRDWNRDTLAPHNPYTGTYYSGGNLINLALIAMASGWQDPRWVTLGELRRQAKAAEERGEHWDWKGEHCSLVVCYKPVPFYETDESGETVRDEDGKKKVKGYRMRPLKPHYVLNMAQVKGAPKWEEPEETREPLPSSAFEAADILAASGVCPVDEGSYFGACYVDSLDVIRIPSRERFASGEGFASTLAHELVHATGEKNRLDRDLSGRFGSSRYACEELVAELGSVLVCSQLGFSYKGVEDVANHAAYLEHWAQMSRKDAAAAMQQAFAAAQKACAYIMERVPKQVGKAA